MSTPAQAPRPQAAIVSLVVLLHIALIYGVQRGVLLPAPKPELVIPFVLTSRLVEPPAPDVIAAKAPLPVPAPAPSIKPVVKPAVKPPMLPPTLSAALPAPQQPVKAAAAPAATPSPLAIAPAVANSAAAVAAPAGSATGQAAPATISAPNGLASSTESVASGSSQLPSSDADYLQNPKPGYPAISRRLNEQGKTMVRVLIGADGQPQRAEVSQSSGFARLDSAAVATTLRWRYVPGKRNGVPETMWFTVPINWTLSE